MLLSCYLGLFCCYLGMRGLDSICTAFGWLFAHLGESDEAVATSLIGRNQEDGCVIKSVC